MHFFFNLQRIYSSLFNIYNLKLVLEPIFYGRIRTNEHKGYGEPKQQQETEVTVLSVAAFVKQLILARLTTAHVREHYMVSWVVVYRTTDQRHHRACQFQQTKKSIKKPSQPLRVCDLDRSTASEQPQVKKLYLVSINMFTFLI